MRSERLGSRGMITAAERSGVILLLADVTNGLLVELVKLGVAPIARACIGVVGAEIARPRRAAGGAEMLSMFWTMS